MRPEIFQDPGNGGEDNYDRYQDLPDSAVVLFVRWFVAAISPDQCDAENGDKENDEGNLSVRKMHTRS